MWQILVAVKLSHIVFGDLLHLLELYLLMHLQTQIYLVIVLNKQSLQLRRGQWWFISLKKDSYYNYFWLKIWNILIVGAKDLSHFFSNCKEIILFLICRRIMVTSLSICWYFKLHLEWQSFTWKMYLNWWC